MDTTTTLLAALALAISMTFDHPAEARQDDAPAPPASAAEGGGTLIVLNKAEATVSLLDRDATTGEGEAFAMIGVGIGPHEVAVSPDGKTAVVCNYGDRANAGNSLTVIDLPQRRAVRTIDLGEYRRPHGIVYLSDGERIVVTSEVAKKLIVVNVPEGAVEHAIDTNAEISHMVAVTPDESRAFVANLGSSSISAIDLKNKALIKVVATGRGAEGVDVSPDGREIWVGNRAANNITIIDAETLELSHTLPCPTFPIRCKFTPDGQRVLVSNAESGDVVVFDTLLRGMIKRIPMELTATETTDERLFGDRFGDSPVPVGILITPDGRHAYVANTNADIITLIDLESLEIAGRLTAGKEPDGLGWTPLELSE